MAAGLRRSFRLRKDRQGGSPVEPRTPDATQTDFLIYEEVTRYQTRRGERSRLIVLIGRIALCDHHFVSENPVGRTVYSGLGCRTPRQNGFGWNPNILSLPVESSYVTCLWLPYFFYITFNKYISFNKYAWNATHVSVVCGNHMYWPTDWLTVYCSLVYFAPRFPRGPDQWAQAEGDRGESQTLWSGCASWVLLSLWTHAHNLYCDLSQLTVLTGFRRLYLNRKCDFLLLKTSLGWQLDFLSDFPPNICWGCLEK